MFEDSEGSTVLLAAEGFKTFRPVEGRGPGTFSPQWATTRILATARVELIRLGPGRGLQFLCLLRPLCFINEPSSIQPAGRAQPGAAERTQHGGERQPAAAVHPVPFSSTAVEPRCVRSGLWVRRRGTASFDAREKTRNEPTRNR